MHYVPSSEVFPTRLPYFIKDWHLFEPVRLDRVAKRLRAATDLHNILIAQTAGTPRIPISTCPIQSPHSFEFILPGGVHAERRSFHSTPAGTLFTHRETHHGSSIELHTLYIALYLYSFVAFLQCILRRGCRGRWACQAHIHGGDVQRGGAHRTPLCHVLRPMVSEQLPSFFQMTLVTCLGSNLELSFKPPIWTENGKPCLLLLQLTGTVASKLVSTQASRLHNPFPLASRCG